MTAAAVLSARPKPAEGESAVALLVRCAIRNTRRLDDVSWWTARSTARQGTRALLTGDPHAVQQFARLLGRPDVEIARGTLAYLAPFNASRGTPVTNADGYVSRAQQDKGPTTLALPRSPRGSPRPAFVHSWKLPYCPDCLGRAPDRWPLQHHLAVPGVCLQDQRILMFGCGSCGGAGITVAGQVTRPAHCADCGADLRRAKALPLRTVDGLDAAATEVARLLEPEIDQHSHDLLGGLLDLVTLGLISDPVTLRGTVTSRLRNDYLAARDESTMARRPLRLANLPDPAHVAAYLPTALAVARAHLNDPDALSPLVTVRGRNVMTPYDCFLGPATRNRIRRDRRRLHHVLAASTAGSRFTPRLPACAVPELLPLPIYERHLADLSEPILTAAGWPGPIEVRHALASQFRGQLGWHLNPPVFDYGRSHQYHDEAVLHSLYDAMAAAGLDERWMAGVTGAAADLSTIDVDWELRRGLLADDRVVDRILTAVPAADPDEAHRWLHQVWACTTEPTLGLYGASTYLLDDGETSSDLAAQLQLAADQHYQAAKQAQRRRRA